MITVQIHRLGCGRIPTLSTLLARARALSIALERRQIAVQNLGQSSSPCEFRKWSSPSGSKNSRVAGCGARVTESGHNGEYFGQGYRVNCCQRL
jgi:hypothetical protein